MHVLLTNDDGPPNDITSPYIRFLVDAVDEYTDWDLSICLPSVQKSWIGKAYFAGKNLTASFIYPTNIKNSNSFNGPFALPDSSFRKTHKEWALIDSTPAACADIGVNYLYKDKGPVDLVISGPNYGRNTTALYALTSGTIGAALEATLIGKKSIAVSFAFESNDIDEHIIKYASKISVKLIEHLYNSWPNDNSTELYSINIPLIETLNKSEIVYAPILGNKWHSVFTAFDQEPRPGFKEDAVMIKDDPIDIIDGSIVNQLQFRWDPDYNEVHKTVSESNGINDGIVLAQGNIAVTPLRANFAAPFSQGKIHLDI
ncbi:putative tubulin tyrosine ligase [Ascoidea rubescens DSM 1968]|uniref:5'/3'-nucleotidase sure n=1 Tax=Ascoidea rubescens DSM 1968 TaxID=1344418 RepID=A0A1D2VKF9_9ASCO|nr:5'/3'-nucleotidase sure [Ascoidea rubescens DSM 1968]ODV62092.1 5'/3'-nucleotidase sure [Ascoidea rubescens DSM 1968]